MDKNENLIHNKEEQAEYYQKLSAEIKNYEAAILFGPTEAKTELYNIFKENQHFQI